MAAGQVTALLMVIGLIGLIVYQGALTFWPRAVVLATLQDGKKHLGEVVREESFRPQESAETPAALERRMLLRTGNYDLYGDDFKWVPLGSIANLNLPPDAVLVERQEWGVFIGYLSSVQVDGKPVTQGREDAWDRLSREHGASVRRRHEIRILEKDEIGALNHVLERNRLAVRRAELKFGADSQLHRAEVERASTEDELLKSKYQELAVTAARLKAEDAAITVLLEDSNGQEKSLLVSDIVRIYRPNDLGLGEALGVYLSRWWEFLSDDPREANTEGGVFPAIFGTVVMTLLMVLLVAPLGIMAALYLREYARQGFFVSCVRVAVNNLAGVPSIVFGVFGLGFFCYVLGGSIDQVFFQERLPSPTFGTGGLLWAALTLALMTVPVVIVATEEALAAVPRSQREGAHACGASKWQMIWHVILPRALPGILTGIVLAMARGAGEVAPLMITGVVKLAPDLAIDHHFPYVHLERSFMHLGFHIYDVGFQSRNAEAGKPMVFTTTLLLITVILLLNITVIRLRSRIKSRLTGGQF